MPVLSHRAIRKGPRCLSRIAICVFYCAAAGAQDPASQGQDASFKATVNLVMLDISVTDAAGLPIPDLEKDNFEIKENGKRQTILRFERGEAPISLALVFDYSASMKPYRRSLQVAAQALLSMLRPDDEAFLVVLSDKPFALTEPASVETLLRQDTWREALDKRAPAGRTPLHDALILASDMLSQSTLERRVIIALSDGADNASNASLHDVVAKLYSSNELLYCIGLFKPGDPDTKPGVLRKLAASTGGNTFFEPDANKLPQVLSRAVGDMRARYVLGFHARDAEPGKIE